MEAYKMSKLEVGSIHSTHLSNSLNNLDLET